MRGRRCGGANLCYNGPWYATSVNAGFKSAMVKEAQAKWWNVYDADKRSASMKGTESDLEYWVTPETAAAIRKHTDEVWWKEDQSAAFFKKMDKELGKMK